MDLMKALISGSEDTPYTHGLYEFHIACPLEYPKKPPLVSIVTTGNGKVRFNPNLYDDGYVCLLSTHETEILVKDGILLIPIFYKSCCLFKF